jgi:hypothetical protein
MKQGAEKFAITSLKVKKDGSDIEHTLTYIEEILEEAASFYSTLYSSKVSDTNRKAASRYLKANVAVALTKVQKDFCDNCISVEELGKALKKLPNWKAPGIDGLPTEFFERFWEDLKDDFSRNA